MKCNVCHTAVDDAALFCAHCGTQLSTSHDIECDIHAGIAASAVCVVCGAPVCDNCSDVRSNIHFCKSAHHAKYYDEFALLVETPTQFNAEMIVKNLELKGIHAVSFTAKQFVNSTLLRDTTRTHIYVLRSECGTAKNILHELDIMDFTNDNDK